MAGLKKLTNKLFQRFKRQRQLNVLNDIRDCCVILSYPRSGNHWLRFIVEWFSARPTLGCYGTPKDKPICENVFKDGNPLQHVCRQGPPIGIKDHSFDLVISAVEKPKVILIVRDFLECVYRHQPMAEEGEFRKYFDLIQDFDDYQGEKLLVYYEDMIADPHTATLEIAKFLGIGNSESLHKDFMDNYSNLSRQSRSAKGRAWKGSVSGEDVRFHQENLDDEQVNRALRIAGLQSAQVQEYIRRYLPAPQR